MSDWNLFSVLLPHPPLSFFVPPAFREIGHEFSEHLKDCLESFSDFRRQHFVWSVGALSGCLWRLFSLLFLIREVLAAAGSALALAESWSHVRTASAFPRLPPAAAGTPHGGSGSQVGGSRGVQSLRLQLGSLVFLFHVPPWRWREVIVVTCTDEVPSGQWRIDLDGGSWPLLRRYLPLPHVLGTLQPPKGWWA